MPLYFAFGSNLDARQMAARCPGAAVVGPARLEAHRLLFRGPSARRGAGVATVDPAAGHEVPGLVWRVTEEHVARLDAVEGAPRWYRREEAVVVAEGGAPLRVETYRLPGHVAIMAPTDAYLRQIEAAYRALGFDRAVLERALAWRGP